MGRPAKYRTVKQQAWIEGILTGLNPTAAARKAKYSPKLCRFQGYENTTKPHLMQEIAQRKAQLAAETGYTVAQCENEYDEVRKLALQLKQPAAAATAITGKARLYGMDKDANIGEKTVIIIAPRAPKPVESAVIDTKGAENAV